MYYMFVEAKAAFGRSTVHQKLLFVGFLRSVLFKGGGLDRSSCNGVVLKMSRFLTCPKTRL